MFVLLIVYVSSKVVFEFFEDVRVDVVDFDVVEFNRVVACAFDICLSGIILSVLFIVIVID